MLVKFLRKHFKNEFIFGFDKKSRNKLLLQISIIDLVLILIRTAILYPSATNSLQYTYLMGINIVIRLAVIGMLLKGHSDPAAHIYIFSFWVYLTLSAISTGSAFSQHSMGFFVVITMAITLISLNIGILYLFLSISMTATLTMFDVGRLGIPIVVSDTPLTRLITIVTYFILLTLLLKLIQSSLRKLASRGRDINRRYKALFDSTEEGVFIADMELKLIAVNQAAADLLGYEIDELIGTSQFEHIDPEEIKAMGPMIKKLKQGKTIGRFERKMICKDGSRVDLDVNVIPVKDEDGKMFNFQVIIRDISAQKRLEESLHNSLTEMEILARTDPLTGISNRRALEEQGSLHMRLARLGELNLGLIMLDVDHLKKINDTYGHEAGDLVLKEVAKCISIAKRKTDVAGRWAGDEFVVILPGINVQEANIIALDIQKLIDSVDIKYNDELVETSASIGVVCVNMLKDKIKDFNVLVDFGDQAMYTAKKGGQDAVRMYTASN